MKKNVLFFFFVSVFLYCGVCRYFLFFSFFIFLPFLFH